MSIDDQLRIARNCVAELENHDCDVIEIVLGGGNQKPVILIRKPPHKSGIQGGKKKMSGKVGIDTYATAYRNCQIEWRQRA